MDLEKNPHNDGNSIDPLLVKKRGFKESGAFVSKPLSLSLLPYWKSKIQN